MYSLTLKERHNYRQPGLESLLWEPALPEPSCGYKLICAMRTAYTLLNLNTRGVFF
jgi:hypothetical protein